MGIYRTGSLASAAVLMAYGVFGEMERQTAERTAIFKEYLSRAPELTERVIESAYQSSSELVRDFSVTALISAGLTGFVAAAAAYDFAKTIREDKIRGESSRDPIIK